MSTGMITLGIIAAIVIALIAIYNKLVANRQMVKEGWSGIDVQLKRRANLIPNLLETVKGYMQHERGVLEDVTKMRANVQHCKEGDIAARSMAESGLAGALGKLFAVAENYPELKANTTFMELQQNLSEIEDHIQMARRYYNGTVRSLNILVESFPSNLVAKMFNFVKEEYFEIEDEAERAVPKMDFSTGS